MLKINDKEGKTKFILDDEADEPVEVELVEVEKPKSEEKENASTKK
jgi:hypothetical protein